MGEPQDKWKTRTTLYKKMWNDAGSTPEERMRNIMDFYVEEGRFDANGIREAQVISVDTKTGHVIFQLTVQPYLCSKMKTLHGGAACTLLDMLTTASLMFLARPGFLDMGSVSRTITMTYLRPVQEGETVRIECWPVSLGKRYANVYGEIKNLDGKIAVSCIHDKAVFPSSL